MHRGKVASRNRNFHPGDIILTTSIILHALGDHKPHSINTAKIAEVVEARFGGCGIWFVDQSLPSHFWETKEHVLNLMMPASK
jgi:hypothetical protein